MLVFYAYKDPESTIETCCSALQTALFQKTFTKEEIQPDSFGPHHFNLITAFFSSIFQHFRLIKLAASCPQETDVLIATKSFELATFAPCLVDAIPLEQYEAEESARDLAAKEILRADAIKNLDVLDCLTPLEIKQATLETVISAFEALETDLERQMHDQMQRLVGLVPKTV